MVPSGNIRHHFPAGSRQSQCGPIGSGCFKSGRKVSPVLGLYQLPSSEPGVELGFPFHSNPFGALAGSLPRYFPEFNVLSDPVHGFRLLSLAYFIPAAVPVIAPMPAPMSAPCPPCLRPSSKSCTASPGESGT